MAVFEWCKTPSEISSNSSISSGLAIIVEMGMDSAFIEQQKNNGGLICYKARTGYTQQMSCHCITGCHSELWAVLAWCRAPSAISSSSSISPAPTVETGTDSTFVEQQKIDGGSTCLWQCWTTSSIPTGGAKAGWTDACGCRRALHALLLW